MGTRPKLIGTTALLMGFIVGSGPTASAGHTEYTFETSTYDAGAFDDDRDGFNGMKVYLSSPRHTDSGSRGELGWDENINGRLWNTTAAQSSLLAGSETTSRFRNIGARGYNVKVSGNARDGAIVANVREANNWGADVYVTSHTNAGGGDYFLTMTDQNGSTLDRALRASMATHLGESVPTGTSVRQATDAGPFTNGRNLAELGASNAASYVVYNEVIFHDNAEHVTWFGAEGDDLRVTFNAWRYGWAVDMALGYP